MPIHKTNINKLAERIERRESLSPLDQIAEAIKSEGDNVIYERSTTNYDIRRRIDSVKRCSTYFETAHFHTGESQIVSRHACNDSYFCPVCAERRSNKRFFSSRHMIKTAQDWGLNLYFVTFTVRDNENPYLQYEQLAQGIRNFQRMGQKGRSGEWSKVEGAFINFEAKKGSGSGLFHIHAHAIFAVRGMLDYRIYDIDWREEEKKAGRKLTKEDRARIKATAKYLRPDEMSKIENEWFRATGCRGINVSPIKKGGLGKYDVNGNDVIDKSELKKTPHKENAIRELFKYPAKMADFISDFSFSEVARLYDCIKSRRNFRATGIFSPGSIFFDPGKHETPPLNRPDTLIVGHSTHRYRPGDITAAATFDEFSTPDTAFAFRQFHTSGKRKEIAQARGYILAEYNEIRRHCWQNLPREFFVQCCKTIVAETKRTMTEIQERPESYWYGRIWQRLHDRAGDRRHAAKNAHCADQRRRRQPQYITDQIDIVF